MGARLFGGGEPEGWEKREVGLTRVSVLGIGYGMNTVKTQ